MARTYEQIDDTMREWIARQPMFFVATAPLAGDGHVNVSPKGPGGTLRVLGPDRVAYLDLVGSGAETIAHLRENGRIVVMFAAFEGPPKIVRLHGRGQVAQQEDDGFAELLGSFDLSRERLRAVRSVITVDVTRVSDSCGFVVPRMRFEGERDQLYRFADNRIRKEGDDAVRRYCTVNNAESLDGLRGLDPLAGDAEPASVVNGRK